MAYVTFQKHIATHIGVVWHAEVPTDENRCGSKEGVLADALQPADRLRSTDFGISMVSRAL
jgi:hypothetical protein